jgi:hypothetical protein
VDTDSRLADQVMTPFSLGAYQRFGGTSCVLLPFYANVGGSSSEMLVSTYQIAFLHRPEDLNLHF